MVLQVNSEKSFRIFSYAIKTIAVFIIIQHILFTSFETKKEKY